MDPVSQFLAASCLNFPPPSTRAESTIVVVPETAINENDGAVAREYHVGFSRHAAFMQAISKTQAKNTPTDLDFNSRIFRLNGCHHT